ncbi:MAG: hypothetical protein ACSHW7_01835 [Patiriisocius sp.]|uniref:hypothetical protein n=1 Tax=Patiriisocius sp. TaxID=2822396 RepID=UPI003EF20B8A
MEYFLNLEFIQVKYTEYFVEQHNQHHSGSNLSKEQTQRMLNIVKAECLWINECGMEKYLLRKEINRLTGRRKPEILWEEMIKLSH